MLAHARARRAKLDKRLGRKVSGQLPPLLWAASLAPKRHPGRVAEQVPLRGQAGRAQRPPPR